MNRRKFLKICGLSGIAVGAIGLLGIVGHLESNRRNPRDLLTVFEETDLIPLSQDTSLENILPQHKAAAENLVLLSSTIGSGTGFFINPYQILTADHCVKNARALFIETNKTSGQQKNIIDTIQEDKESDLAVMDLKESVQDVHALSFYKDSITKGLSIVLVSYDISEYDVKIRYESGVITDVCEENGIKRYRDNLPVIHGNSGGAVLDYKTGALIGVRTLYHTSPWSGPTIQNLHIVDRTRELTDEELARKNGIDQEQNAVQTDLLVENKSQHSEHALDDAVVQKFFESDANISIDNSSGKLCLENGLCVRTTELGEPGVSRIDTSIINGDVDQWVTLTYRDGKSLKARVINPMSH